MRGRYAHALVAAGILLVAAAVLASPALAQGFAQGHRPFAMGPGGPRPFLWAAAVFALLRGVLLVSLIALAWKAIGARGLWHRPDTATQALRERYARGEITDDEYRKRVATLG